MQERTSVNYKGFEIAVYKAVSPRFGTLFGAEAQIGEPGMDTIYWKDRDTAIRLEKEFIDMYIEECEECK